MEDSVRKMKELEIAVLNKIGEVIQAIETAKHVDQVISSLYSIASLLFPLDNSLIAGTIDHKYREQVLGTKVLCAEVRAEWWHAFYRGAAFPALARILLLDVASNWLACFPFSARTHVYDIFFINGLATEVVQTLVSFLQQNGNTTYDVTAVASNIERLLVLCLLEHDGILQMAREFGKTLQSEVLKNDGILSHISRVAQTVASIPDKTRLKALPSLSSHLFFKQITAKLLYGVGKGNVGANVDQTSMDGTLLFTGEVFSRICRRGSADVLLSELIPRLRGHVQSLLSSKVDPDISDVIVTDPDSQFWLKIMEVIRDPYSVERISEQLLPQLASENINDLEAHWILWTLYHKIFSHNPSIRSMFIEKFLVWKVFPLCCLRWILQFAVVEYPPFFKGRNTRGLLDTVQNLAVIWSKKEFVQSASLEQQAYVTAALGLLLEKMSKEELDETKDVMHSILQGVSCRLESPDHLVRKMASSIALIFSKVIDPMNPLYLDESCTDEPIDWEFGLNATRKGYLLPMNGKDINSDRMQVSTTANQEKDVICPASDIVANNVKGEKKKVVDLKLVDPDEIVDPAILNNGSGSDQDSDDNASEISDASSDSSLPPYDLSDDSTDLKRKFSQLVDVVGALRKRDDADAIESALDVAEKLIRSAPDELRHLAGDLARTLVQVRCSDVAVHGEEDSTEEKRQRSLVALLVTCPFESLDTLNKLLYSPNADVSQRIMILDVMTDAAQELANTRTLRSKPQSRPLISTTSETQPWFLPSSMGPPGAGPWKEISGTGTLLNWPNSYEREIPSKSGQNKRGKTRRWSLASKSIHENPLEWSHNKFPVYAAAFILPAMQGFDKKRHGVDLLDRDFIVLGKLIYMLGVCMKCMTMHPEATALVPPLLDMLRSREVCEHKEAYVRRAVLFALSCVLVALHPSFIASALVEGNLEISKGLEWIRTWALDIVESDIDRECYMMAVACLKLHAEMALQVTREIESAKSTSQLKGVGLSSSLSKATIRMPGSNVDLI